MYESSATYRAYPVVVHGRAGEPLSRWLWLVKWLLLIPHYIALVFLGVAFAVVTVVAFFAILFTGRYPRGLFSFNLGVLRWGWRVSYYGYNALGTDRYPPFTLAEVPDYPATLDIAYPERLSRGLALVKWWLLALPHYLVLAFLVGGAAWTYDRVDGGREVFGLGSETAASGGLVGLLVLFAGAALLFTRRYPHGLYDLVMGLNRWALRVTAYAALMTDAYPPFRLDQGGAEPAPPVGPGPSSPGSGLPEQADPAGAGTAHGTQLSPGHASTGKDDRPGMDAELLLPVR
jgi:hypothetical protein